MTKAKAATGTTKKITTRKGSDITQKDWELIRLAKKYGVGTMRVKYTPSGKKYNKHTFSDDMLVHHLSLKVIRLTARYHLGSLSIVHKSSGPTKYKFMYSDEMADECTNHANKK